MEWMISLDFRTIDRTRFVTAASEIARNMLIHGRGGELRVRELKGGAGPGLELVFADQGPGIASITEALRPGFSTGKGLGLGLSGARNLSHEFKIESRLGAGCTVRMVRWKK
jgi:serine/threonine-protein kinase RsbT